MAMPRAVGADRRGVRIGQCDAVFTLSAVVTREGRVENLELHSPMRTQPRPGSREAEARG